MSLALLPYSRRTEFSGLTDKYRNPLRPNIGGTLDEARAGIAPFDVFEGLMSESMAEDVIARRASYVNQWNFYNGDHFTNAYEDGELKVVANFCERIADTSVDFFLADGISMSGPSGNEPVAELINLVWGANEASLLQERMAQFGAVTGDAFVYVTIQTKDEQGVLLPKEKQQIKLAAIDPAQVIPFWHPTRPGEMTQCAIQMVASNPEDETQQILLTLVITAQRWRIYYDEKLIKDRPNPFGRINVVHIPNFVHARSMYGKSDLQSVIPLNEEYNLVLNTIRRIIKYHAEPTTLIFGAKVSDLEKGAKKVWSGLPVEGKVQNLLLESDLAATQAHLANLRDLIAVFGGMPKVLFSSESLSISNTSGLAMAMTFQPMIEKTNKRRRTYTPGLQRINALIVRGLELTGVPVKDLVDSYPARYLTAVNYTSPLPRDEKSEMDVAVLKLQNRIWSRAEAVRQLSGTEDYSRLILELAADDSYDLARAFELQRANSGINPNQSVAFLSSVALTEDFEELVNSMPEPEGPKEEENESASKSASGIS